MLASRKEPLELREDLHYIPTQNAESEANFRILRGSLIERDKRHNLKWPVHFRTWTGGPINHREETDLRALFSYGIETDTADNIVANLPSHEIVRSHSSLHDGGQYSPVLVDVAEIVNYG